MSGASSRAVCGVFALAMAALSCGRSTKAGPEPTAGGGAAPAIQADGGMGGEGEGEPAVTSPCPPGLPTAEELASTPREHVDLELLALKVSPGIVADSAAYERVVRDVNAIKALQPELADISHYSNSRGREIVLTVDATTYGDMQGGRYEAWSCLNETYGFQQAEYFDFGGFSAFLTLEGIYQLDRVAQQYATLPGVLTAVPTGGGSDGPTICLTVEGGTWHYVFDRASGDCLAGCIDHEYSHFSSDAQGSIKSLGALPVGQVTTYASHAACH